MWKRKKKREKWSETSTSKTLYSVWSGYSGTIHNYGWGSEQPHPLEVIYFFCKAAFGSSWMISRIVNSYETIIMVEPWKRDKEDDIDHPGSYNETTSWKTKNGWYDDTNGIFCLFTGSSLNLVVFLIFENRQVMSLLTMAVCLLSQVWCASSGIRRLLNSPATRQRYVFIQSSLFCFSLWPPLSTSDVHDSRFFFLHGGRRQAVFWPFPGLRRPDSQVLHKELNNENAKS